MSPSERDEFIRLCDLFMLSICLEETDAARIMSAIEAWRKVRHSAGADNEAPKLALVSRSELKSTA